MSTTVTAVATAMRPTVGTSMTTVPTSVTASAMATE